MKLINIILVLAMSATLSGCLVGGGTTVVYPHKQTTVVKKTQTSTAVVVEETVVQPTTVVYEEEPYIAEEVVVYEEYYVLEPYYSDYCEMYDGGMEECCYDYDWNIVWLNSHEYVYEVCEYTSCVDYWHGDAWMDDIICWYE